MQVTTENMAGGAIRCTFCTHDTEAVAATIVGIMVLLSISRFLNTLKEQDAFFTTKKDTK